MDRTDASHTSDGPPGARDTRDDATAAYQVTGPPTGGPGGWPNAAPVGEAREVFERMVRETDEPPLRQAVRLVLTIVVIVIVTVGTIAWRDLDDRIDRQEREVRDLQVRVQQLEAGS